MKKHLTWLLLIPFLFSCVSYKSQELSFKPPEAYKYSAVIAGANVAAKGYDDKKEAKNAFGFDIIKAGVLPIQVVFNNKSNNSLEIVPDQTFLIDNSGKYWPVLSKEKAYSRLEKSSEYNRIAKGAGKRSVLGAAGGAIVGSAVGILSGENVLSSAGKGAAVGAAGGAIFGGAEEIGSDKAEQKIRTDLAQKELENKKIKPQILATGFLFFPSEAPTAAKLRLQLKDTEKDFVYTVTLPLNE